MEIRTTSYQRSDSGNDADHRMKVLLLNQCFYPDVVATAQHLSDLAVGLAEEGHQVTVVTGDRGYDNPANRFPRRETWNGIKIIRVSSLAFGKTARWRRALNFASFLINCAVRLAVLPRFDVVVALTSPPLISFLGAAFAQIKGGQFFLWLMDLNPDEAIAAGWLRQHSRPARILNRLLHYSLLQADRVVALDSFMKQRIVAKGIPQDLVSVIPPWAHDDSIKFDSEGREAFRREHNLSERFVVMYAGNHSPCHPLDTLVEAARRLSNHPEIVFYFVGGGSEQKKVRDFSTQHSLQNIVCLPYQPFDNLAASLSAADLHTVVMGDAFVGIVHPCKLYNILTIGTPFLYIGPTLSHLGEIARAVTSQQNSSCRAYTASTGDAETVVESILKAAQRNADRRQHCLPEIASRFSKQMLLPRMIELLQSTALAEPRVFAPSERSSFMSASR